MTHLGMGALRTRKAAALAAVAAASLALAACSGGGGTTDETTSATTGPAAESGEVSWWGWTPDTPVAERYIAAVSYTHLTLPTKRIV